jgi:hypothetical protein
MVNGRLMLGEVKKFAPLAASPALHSSRRAELSG